MAERFVFKPGAMAQILKSAPVGEVTRARAEAIAATARARTDDDIMVEQSPPRRRARASVIRLGSGSRGEARDRALGGSVGGA